jgi:hypothetical protein
MPGMTAYTGLLDIGKPQAAKLSYLLRNKRVVKNGDRLTARWSLTT